MEEDADADADDEHKDGEEGDGFGFGDGFRSETKLVLGVLVRVGVWERAYV